MFKSTKPTRPNTALAVVGHNLKLSKKDMDVQTDLEHNLLKQYNEEKEKRERLERDLLALNEKIEQLKANSELNRVKNRNSSVYFMLFALLRSSTTN